MMGAMKNGMPLSRAKGDKGEGYYSNIYTNNTVEMVERLCNNPNEDLLKAFLNLMDNSNDDKDDSLTDSTSPLFRGGMMVNEADSSKDSSDVSIDVNISSYVNNNRQQKMKQRTGERHSSNCRDYLGSLKSSFDEAGDLNFKVRKSTNHAKIGVPIFDEKVFDIGKAKDEDTTFYVPFKTKPCKFEIQGSCTYGAKCHFAHNQLELRNTPDFKRTKLCKNFISHTSKLLAGGGIDISEIAFTTFGAETVGCRKGGACSFAHNLLELRNVDGSFMTLEKGIALLEGKHLLNNKEEDQCDQCGVVDGWHDYQSVSLTDLSNQQLLKKNFSKVKGGKEKSLIAVKCTPPQLFQDRSTPPSSKLEHKKKLIMQMSEFLSATSMENRLDFVVSSCHLALSHLKTTAEQRAFTMQLVLSLQNYIEKE